MICIIALNSADVAAEIGHLTNGLNRFAAIAMQTTGVDRQGQRVQPDRQGRAAVAVSVGRWDLWDHRAQREQPAQQEQRVQLVRMAALGQLARPAQREQQDPQVVRLVRQVQQERPAQQVRPVKLGQQALQGRLV